MHNIQILMARQTYADQSVEKSGYAHILNDKYPMQYQYQSSERNGNKDQNSFAVLNKKTYTTHRSHDGSGKGARF